MKVSVLFLLCCFLLPLMKADQIASGHAVDSMELNFDQLEQEAMQVHAFNTIDYKPPHPLLIWVRIVGSPLVNAYFSLTYKAATFWQALFNFFHQKDCNERSSCNRQA